MKAKIQFHSARLLALALTLALGAKCAWGAIARYNGTDYTTVAEAVAAGETDSWANGSVTLLANAEWTPAAAGTYKIDVAGYTLRVLGAAYTADGTTYTVSELYNCWIGGVGGKWSVAANWSGGLPTSASKVSVTNTVSIELDAKCNCHSLIVADGCVLTLASTVENNDNYKLFVGGGAAAVVSGDIVLNGATLQTIKSVETKLAANFESKENKTNRLMIGNGSGWTVATLTGKLTGSGTLYVTSQTSGGSGCRVECDGSEFYGTLELYATSANPGNTIKTTDWRNATVLLNSNRSSAWNANGDVYGVFTAGASAEYHFGCLQVYYNYSNSSYARWTGQKFYVGYKANSVSSLRGACRSSYKIAVEYVGDGSTVLTNDMSNLSGMTVAKGGSLVIGSSGSKTVNSFSDCGGYMVLTGDSTLDAAYVTALTAVDDGALVGFSSDLEDEAEIDLSSKVSLLTGKSVGKRGSGTVYLTGLEAATLGDIIVSEGTLVLPHGVTVGAVTVADDASLLIDVATVTGTETVFSCTSRSGSVSCRKLSGMMELSGGEGNAWTVTRSPATFVWTAESGDWATPENWTVNNKATYQLPTRDDSILVESGEGAIEIHIDDTVSAKTATFNRDVTLACSTYYASNPQKFFYTEKMTGAGKLTISNAVIRSTAEATIDLPLVIAAASTNWLYAASGCNITVSGNITGTGAIFAYEETYYQRTAFTGDNRDFAGEWKLARNPTKARDRTIFLGVNSVGSNAVYTVDTAAAYGYWNNDSYNGSEVTTFQPANENDVFIIGGLNGSFNMAGCTKNFTIVMGGRDDRDYSFAGTLKSTRWSSSSQRLSVKKVGSRVVTFSGSEMGSLEIAEGAFDLAGADALPVSGIKFSGGTLRTTPYVIDEATEYVDPSDRIASSTEAIVFDSNGGNYIWKKELAASNEKGLVKIGEGTLTLEKKPLYTADTVLNGGTLKIPAAAGVAVKTTAADSKVVTSTETLDTVEYTVYTLQALTAEENPEADENGVIQIPASMSGQYAAYALDAGQSLDCSLLTDASGIKAVVTTTVGSETVDITSYYTAESLAVVNGKIEPKLADSVLVGFADGESTKAAEMSVEEGNVKSTFTLLGANVKKGLYYSVGTVTNPAADSTTDFLALSEQQATADGETISLAPVTLDFGTGNVLYYKWSVSDTAQKTAAE